MFIISGAMPFDMSCVLAVTWSLAGLYIICLIVGGGLLLISTFFGGDADTDVEVDFDVDADIDTDLAGADTHAGPSALALSNWFSMSFLIYFAACFGVVGTVLTYMTAYSSNTVLLAALISGLVVGQAVHHLMRKIKKAEAMPPATPRDYVHKIARVTIAITPGRIGEVALMVRGRERFAAARLKNDNDSFKINDQVVVMAFNNGTTEVVSREEYEFVTDSKPED